MFYTIGIMLLSGVTYFIRDWLHLTLATSLPFALYYLYWFFLPESARWLLTKGRFEEASRILETMARVNGNEVPESFRQQVEQEMLYKRTKSQEKLLKNGPGLAALWKTPNMRLKTILITLNWFANEMVYMGMSYYGPSLGNNQYFSFFLSALVEVPSHFVCWMIIDKWGRRWPLALSMVISGVSCIATVLIPPGKSSRKIKFLLKIMFWYFRGC